MRGARGDAARRAEAAQATTSQSAFGDYVRFDEMFGASCIFTAGDPVQVQRQREAYVKDGRDRGASTSVVYLARFAPADSAAAAAA